MKNETVTAKAPAHWASYLINGDATGFDYSNTPDSDNGDKDYADAQAFEKWIGGHIIDVSESEFGSTFVGGVNKYVTGDLATYTAIIDHPEERDPRGGFGPDTIEEKKLLK